MSTDCELPRADCTDCVLDASKALCLQGARPRQLPVAGAPETPEGFRGSVFSERTLRLPWAGLAAWLPGGCRSVRKELHSRTHGNRRVASRSLLYGLKPVASATRGKSVTTPTNEIPSSRATAASVAESPTKTILLGVEPVELSTLETAILHRSAVCLPKAAPDSPQLGENPGEHRPVDGERVDERLVNNHGLKAVASLRLDGLPRSRRWARHNRRLKPAACCRGCSVKVEKDEDGRAFAAGSLYHKTTWAVITHQAQS